MASGLEAGLPNRHIAVDSALQQCQGDAAKLQGTICEELID